MDRDRTDAQREGGRGREKRRKTGTGTELDDCWDTACMLEHGPKDLDFGWPRPLETRDVGVELDTQLKVAQINGVGVAFMFEVGDKIIGVDKTPVHGMSVDEVSHLIAGEAGTKVGVTFSRNLTRRKRTPALSQMSSQGEKKNVTGNTLHEKRREEGIVGAEENELDETEISDLQYLWKRAGIKINGRLTGDFVDIDLLVSDYLVSKGLDTASLHTKLRSEGNGMTMVEFGRWVRGEQELSTKTAFVQQIDMHRLLASKLPEGIRHDALAGLQRLSRTEAYERCVATAEELSEELWRSLEDLKQQQERINDLLVGGNSKFAMQDQGDDLPEAMFAEIEDFQKGLQGLQGLPHHNIPAAMELEHCSKADSRTQFITPNYNIATTPEKEFEVVTIREKAAAASERGERRVLFYEDLLQNEVVKRARITVPELIALQLYTGPMYVKYNAALRRFPKEELEGNQGNTYVNTITAVVSGIMKLAVVSPLPKGRVVWRGIANRRIPRKFLTSNERGVSGGCEVGLMSTTTSLKTALQYVRDGRVPTIMKMSVGAVNMGASLQFLSQYPGEEEILFPPLSFLEKVGTVRMCLLQGILVRVIDVNVSANHKSATVEALHARRKEMHLSTADFAYLEVSRDLDTLSGSPDLLNRLKRDPSAVEVAAQKMCSESGDDTGFKMELEAQKLLSGDDNGFKELASELVSGCKEEFKAFVDGQTSEGEGYYNSDEQYLRAVSDLLERKATASAKIRLYIETPTMFQFHVPNMNLMDARREILGQLAGRLHKAKQEGDTEGARAAASELCKETGRMVQDPEELIGGMTTLMRAAGKRDAQGIRLLLDAGANPSRVEGWQTSKGRGFTRSWAYSALRVASETRDVECAVALIEGGADVNQIIGDKQEAAIHFAAMKGSSEVLRVLLDAKADVHAGPDRQHGMRAIHWASYGGHTEVVRVLVDAKADVAAVDEDGLQALHAAAFVGHVETVRLLVEATGKVDINSVGEVGVTALHLAAAMGNVEVTRILVEAKADLHSIAPVPILKGRDEDGRGDGGVQIQDSPQPPRESPYAQVQGTALEVAVLSGHAAVAELLRKAEAREVGSEVVREEL